MARAKALRWELSRLAGEAARGLEACSRMSDRRRQTEVIALTLRRQIACRRVGTARTELLPRVKQESPAELCREGGCDRIHHRSPAQSGGRAETVAVVRSGQLPVQMEPPRFLTSVWCGAWKQQRYPERLPRFWLQRLEGWLYYRPKWQGQGREFKTQPTIPFKRILVDTINKTFNSILNKINLYKNRNGKVLSSKFFSLFTQYVYL